MPDPNTSTHSMKALRRLQDWADEQRLNQTQLAERLGITGGAISNWHGRGGVPLRSIPLLVRATGVPYHEFVDDAPGGSLGVAQARAVYDWRTPASLREAVLLIGRWIDALASPVLRDQAARALQSLGEHPDLARREFSAQEQASHPEKPSS